MSYNTELRTKKKTKPKRKCQWATPMSAGLGKLFVLLLWVPAFRFQLPTTNSTFFPSPRVRASLLAVMYTDSLDFWRGWRGSRRRRSRRLIYAFGVGSSACPAVRLICISCAWCTLIHQSHVQQQLLHLWNSDAVAAAATSQILAGFSIWLLCTFRFHFSIPFDKVIKLQELF